MKSRPYSGWFGEGDLAEDVAEAILQYGQSEKVYAGGYIAALVYPDKIVCLGYDGNEYCHEFLLDEDVTEEEAVSVK